MTSAPPDLDAILQQPTVSGWDLTLAAGSIVAAWIISIYAKKGVIAALGRLQGVSAGATILTARIVRYGIILVGIGVAFSFLGASVQPLIAVAVVVVAVVFLALRGVSANFAAGVVLQTRHPVRVGDIVESGEIVGTVQELNGRSVVLLTIDGRSVHVPNSTFLDELIVNHSSHGRRRSTVSIRYDTSASDIVQIRRTVSDAARSEAGVIPPDPSTQVISVEPGRVTLRLLLWHLPGDGPAVTSAVVEAVADALETAGATAVVTSLDAPAPLTPPATM